MAEARGGGYQRSLVSKHPLDLFQEIVDLDAHDLGLPGSSSEALSISSTSPSSFISMMRASKSPSATAWHTLSALEVADELSLRVELSSAIVAFALQFHF